MKTIFKNNIGLIIILLITFYSGSVVNAQQHDRHQGPPSIPDSTQIVRMMDELGKELSLSESQKASVSKLHFAHIQQAKEIMEKDKADHEKNREAMEAIRKDFENQVTELFNKEQKKKFKEFMKNKRPPHDGKHRP